MKGTKNRPVSTPRKGANARTPKLPQIPDLQEMDKKGKKLMSIYTLAGLAVIGAGLVGYNLNDNKPGGAASSITYNNQSPRTIYQAGVPSQKSLAEYYLNAGRYQAYQEAMEIRKFLRTERDGDSTAQFFNGMLDRLGPDTAVDAFLISQTPNIPLPPQGDEKYIRILDIMSEKEGMNLSGLKNNQYLFKRAFFQSAAGSFMLTSPEAFALKFGGDVVNSVLEQTGNDEWSVFFKDVLAKVDPASEAYFRQTGSVPTKERAAQLLRQGYTAVLYENEIPTHSSPSYYNEQRSGSITGETVTREVPLDSPGDPRYATPQPNYGRPQQDFNQNMQKAQDDARRAAGQAIQGAGRAAGPTIDALKKILPTPTPQRGRGGGGKQN